MAHREMVRITELPNDLRHQQPCIIDLRFTPNRRPAKSCRECTTFISARGSPQQLRQQEPRMLSSSRRWVVRSAMNTSLWKTESSLERVPTSTGPSMQPEVQGKRRDFGDTHRRTTHRRVDHGVQVLKRRAIVSIGNRPRLSNPRRGDIRHDRARAYPGQLAQCASRSHSG
jgi:hypothetical protein